MNDTDKKLILEWCGLKWFWNHSPACKCGAVDDDDSMRSWHYKDGHEWKLATRFWNEEITLDLNFYERYAVPFGHPFTLRCPLAP